MTVHTRHTISVLIPIGLVLLVASNLMAFGSKEKTPEEQAAESRKQAISKYNDGVKHMETARRIGIKGDSLYAYNYRATSDAKAKKEFEKAADNFREAIALDPKLPEAYNNLGYSYRKLGRLEESLSAYAKAIVLDNNFAQAREYRGETYLALGDLAKAQEEQAFLTQLKSPYADTLAKSIEVFQLEKFAKPGK